MTDRYNLKAKNNGGVLMFAKNKSKITIISIIVAVLIALGCSVTCMIVYKPVLQGAPSPGNLTLVISPDNGGYAIYTDNVNGGSQNLNNGDSIGAQNGAEGYNMEAVCYDGYVFVKWAVISEANGYTTVEYDTQTITLRGPADITLYFEEVQPTNNVSISSNDTNMGSVSGGGAVAEGEPTTITATALDGYMFLYWVDNNSNIVSYESSYTFTPTSDVTYTAIFADYFAIHDGNDFITTYTKFYDANRMELIVLIEPPTNTYITAISFDNVNFYELDSWEGKVYLNCPFAMSVTYAISEGNNKIGLTFNYAERDNKIDIYVTTSSVGYDGLKTYTNSVLGVAVSATKGGTVSIIGDEYENLEDDALITCIAKVSMKNYEFVGWYNANDMETCISTSESTRFPKSQIIDSQIVAVFQQIDNGNVNDDLNN